MTRPFSRCYSIEPSVISQFIIAAPFRQIKYGMYLASRTFERVAQWTTVTLRRGLRYTCIKSFPFSAKPNSGIFEQEAIDILDIAVAAESDAADLRAYSIHTDRYTRYPSSLKIGKTSLQKFRSAQDFEVELVSTTLRTVRKTAVSIKITSYEVVKQMLGNLFKCGKFDSKTFSRTAPFGDQTLTQTPTMNMYSYPVGRANRATIDRTILTMTAVNCRGSLKIFHEPFEVFFVLFGQRDGQIDVASIDDTSVRIQESQPVSLGFGVYDIEESFIHRMFSWGSLFGGTSFYPLLFEVEENRLIAHSKFLADYRGRLTCYIALAGVLNLFRRQFVVAHTRWLHHMTERFSEILCIKEAA